MQVWYVGYGTNMSRARLDCYLRGGRPVGGARTYAGARDPSAPTGRIPVLLPGTVYFAGRSRVWGGGRAFYDPDLAGGTAGCAYLLTGGQFDDVLAQEPACYDRVLDLGGRDGVPMRTFTSTLGRADVVRVPPSAAYRATMADGLREVFGWDAARAEDYLGSLWR